GTTKLNADSIAFDWNTFTLHAAGKTNDSTGEVVGEPVFSEGDKDYKSSRMAYNFRSKKGKVYEVYTQEGDSYLQSEAVKRLENEDWFGLHNKYTTCNLEHPHYYFKAKKIKLVPKKYIITGPANLYISDIPTPLYLPFGIFPIKQDRRSGIIFPQFGEDIQNGFFLKQVGYFWAINDYLSLKTVADVYTNGTFGLYPTLTYAKMYKFTGSLGLGWIRTMAPDPDIPNQSVRNDFQINWTFNLDQRAAPTNTFSAAINFISSSYLKAQRATTNNQLLQTSFSSNVNYQKIFPRIPFLSLSLSLAHSQNIATRQFQISFPIFRVNISRVTPFKSKVSSGKPKWYESIGITYNFEIKNQLNTYDSLLFRSDIFKKMQYGTNQVLSIDAPFTVAKYLNITPAIKYTERWYLQSINKNWVNQDLVIQNPDGTTFTLPQGASYVKTDTAFGFKGVRDFNASVTFATKVVGIYNFKGKWIKGFRHIFTPQIIANYQPNFGSQFWGYYNTIQSDILNQNPLTYSPYSSNVYGVPSSGMIGAININLNNNFEMKVFSKDDSVKHEKKISPIERFNISGGYNFAALTNKVNVITMNGSVRILDYLSGTFNIVLDPYALDSTGKRSNTFQYKINKQLLRFQNGNVSLNTTFQGKSKVANDSSKGFSKIDYVSWNPYQPYNFNIPWRVTATYTFGVSAGRTIDQKSDSLMVTQSLMLNGDVNLTPHWKLALSTGFDFRQKQPTLTTVQVVRDLHCWVLS
ncbi:MAG TPA: putative LPS assembly protein LptD, partial [Chitinophagales bacterium]